MRRWIIAVGAVLALGAPAVQAQTDYPGSTTSTTTGASEEVIRFGLVVEGTGFRNEACLFLHPSNVTVTFNGQSVETDNVEQDTCARQDVFVERVGPTSGPDPERASVGRHVLAVAGLRTSGEFAQQQAQVVLNIDGRQFAGKMQDNTLIVSGTGANGHPRRVTTVFSVADRSSLGGGGGTGGGTGGGDSTGTRSPLARTGASILMWVGAGLLALFIGVGLNRAAARRRRHLTV